MLVLALPLHASLGTLLLQAASWVPTVLTPSFGGLFHGASMDVPDKTGLAGKATGQRLSGEDAKLYPSDFTPEC